MTTTNEIAAKNAIGPRAGLLVDLRRDPAARRRQALRAIMDRFKIKPYDLARAAGFSTPNALYNFLRGETFSLSYATYERLAAVLPGVTIDMLAGKMPMPGDLRGSLTVVLKAAPLPKPRVVLASKYERAGRI